jgi:hypothetical protein
MMFLYDLEFVPYEKPPHTGDRFTEDLREFFESRGLDSGMSAMGGMGHTRGDGRGRGRPVIEEDRQALARWAESQRVRCTARLGAVEEDREGLALFREVTEWVFQVDILMDGNRAEAAAYAQRIRERVRSAQEGPT